jgi:hypothetical protein
MMPEDRPYIQYPFRSPRMDRSVPSNQVKVGSCGRLSGVDGRFSGGHRKYYGNKEVLDLTDVTGMEAVDDYNGPDFVQYVTFQKRNTATVYRGFVVRWDSQDSTSNEQIDLVYTADDGSTWTKLAIWAAGNGITSALEIDCSVDRGYLMVAVDTKATKTVYWSGSALVAVSSGPGAFSSSLGAVTKNTTSTDTSYQLNGGGSYQVAWRFYSSTRGIRSALSDPLTIHLEHYETTKAVGTVSFSSTGGDSGLFVDGDVITINSRVYEADDDSSYAGDVQVDVSGLSTIAEHAQALADAINGDSSAVVTAYAQSTSVLLESIARGSTGNAYTLAKTEGGANQDDISVSGASLTGGGFATETPEKQCKAVLDFPANGSVVSGQAYAGFDALFDTVDVFRTIDLGDNSGTAGAIFYLEQTIAKTGNWATSGAWDSLQVTVGTLVDDALPFQTQYDPEKDIVSAPPQSGAIGRYENQTYMAQAASVDGGYDTLFSSALHASAEYFSTYNKRIGDPEDGRPLRFIPVGESMFQLSHNAIVHIFKSGKYKPIQFSRLHQKRGLVSKAAAHAAGNSVFMISGLGLSTLNGTDGVLAGISTADRAIFDDWKSDLADIKSGYDSLMNASFFLDPTRSEMLVVWHSTQVCTMLDGANFVEVTEGPDLTGKNTRAFFVTQTGLIVSTATSAGSTLTDTGATYHADMIGTLVYMVTGDNAGLAREVSSINGTTITFTSSFPNAIAVGDTYAVSPVPYSARAWSMQAAGFSRFNRWVTSGVAVKSGKLSGFDSNVNNKWRIGAYRNGSTTLETTTATPSVSEDPDSSAEVLQLHGIDLEPYVEQIASGVSFELTDLEFSVSATDSRKD